eukprot:TRINITY_DN7965_c0_g1_i11.p1 TRINITY_DN7965_c0_g1~~TRINITY_DN7965_c0_g1_i11.p1  ORF type:complete len:149 (-),score=1.91 TRINITY_DN7965_c0_g1_i11:331-777(-)
MYKKYKNNSDSSQAILFVYTTATTTKNNKICQLSQILLLILVVQHFYREQVIRCLEPDRESCCYVFFFLACKQRMYITCGIIRQILSWKNTQNQWCYVTVKGLALKSTIHKQLLNIDKSQKIFIKNESSKKPPSLMCVKCKQLTMSIF